MEINSESPKTDQRLPKFRTLEKPVLTPQPGVGWAEKMTLNPAILADPDPNHPRRIHMLFRASGPGLTPLANGEKPAYPIFLGYACSEDGGLSWNADFSKPALAPALCKTPEGIRIKNREGKYVVNHSNGCVEDPRLALIEGKLYLSTACRMFAPGPYWERDGVLDEFAPAWARPDSAVPHGMGAAANENLTVTVLWEVDLRALSRNDYERAFTYVAPLTDPERGDNRDAFLFPRKLRIDGRERYVCLHRPLNPERYGKQYEGIPPSIFLAVADRIEDFSTARAQHRLLCAPAFEWEKDRVGASWTPIELGGGQWLLPYHGKQDGIVGYTQSFMILKECPDGQAWPAITHRCPDRLMYAKSPWELSGFFKTPCVFTCAGLVRGADLMMSYGAADTVAGVAWVDFGELLAHVRKYDAQGRPLK